MRALAASLATLAVIGASVTTAIVFIQMHSSATADAKTGGVPKPTGMSSPPREEPTALFTLVAALVAAAVSLAGLLLKQAIDKQTESRLRLDAGIRALQLFSTSAGKPSLRVQRAGAVLMLSSLGQHSLALSLSTFLARRKDIEPVTLVRAIIYLADT